MIPHVTLRAFTCGWVEIRKSVAIAGAKGVLETLRKVSALREEDTEVIIAHDPEFWNTVPQAPLKVC